MGVFQLAVKNLKRRRVRTALTISSVVIAISFTVGLLSISEGFMIAFEETTMKRGADIYVVPRGEMLPLFGAGASTIPQERVESLRELDNVKIAVPVLSISVSIEQMARLPLVVRGYVPQALLEFAPYATLKEGRFMMEGEYALVIGSTVAEGRNLGLNDSIEIAGVNFTVVGVLNPLGGYLDTFVMAPLDTLQEVFRREGFISYVLVKVEEVGKVDSTVQLIEESFPDLSALTARDVVNQMNELLGRARAVHLSVASVSILMGVLFIFSTMMMTVSERVREIGTMRAIGASRGYVFKLIILESVIMGLIGGLIGCVGGYAMSKIIGVIIAAIWEIAFFETLVTLRILAWAMVIALIVGGFAGVYPAWVASKQNIVEALRYE